MLYVTYRVNGLLKRGCISQNQYNLYLKDPKVSDMQIHANQTFMESFYNESTGNYTGKSTRQLLKG